MMEARRLDAVSERGLREAVLGTVDWQEQRRRWDGLRARWTRWARTRVEPGVELGIGWRRLESDAIATREFRPCWNPHA